MKWPNISHDHNDKPRPFVVKCNGQVFAGFDTYSAALAARDMWGNQPRPKNKNFEFTVERRQW